MSSVRRHRTLGTVLVVAALAAGCGGTSRSADATAASSGTTSPAAGQSSPAPPAAESTRPLDAIAVLGHSGTTGYDSDPEQPGTDIPENSWATGTNPAVRSIYQRLLATHPDLKNHTTSLGVDGSVVDDLAAQVDVMLSLDPLPDVVIIQTIDNDMQCDGTDAANQKRFGKTLGTVLDTINSKDRYAQIFFVDVWGSVQTYTEVTKDLPASVAAASGNGPCDTYASDGKVRPAGVASEQRIIDGYFRVIERVCAAHPRCWTDGGELKQMPLRPGDLASDANHLSVQGHAVMARYAWDALPDAIKNRA